MEANILSLDNETHEKNPHLKTFFNRDDKALKVDIKEMN